ncbi:lipopolysaccharide biosynthesis protein [Mesonia ostreae]|uniref:Polysaccharide biosynthesis C-terminal domain-containing protein n=1 Tax=Mesonia ostreae TaxID=861110 RepID=A0ABU2KK37_9FLAO|nr:polysaccharide biosynthesis C-terminal domain-containing protein [Mesonia ostreae]MDT0295075.1 polysaccharide biosynthesis C-terminal domain-containing protein [Mesonia ostreae]
MGIILDQSFKNMMVTYIGFAIGAINVLILYPHFFEPKYYGLITYLLSASTLVWPIMGFGVHNTIIKFYTSYKNEEDKNALLTLAILLPLAVGAVIGIISYLFQQQILNYFDSNTLVRPYVWLILVIAIAVAYFEVFFAWSKLKLKSVFGNFMKEVFHRLFVTIFLILFYYNIIDISLFIYLLTGVYVLRTLIIKLYAYWLLPPKLRFQFPQNKIQVFKYSFLIIIAGSIATALLDLDKVMIEHYLPIEEVSVYGIAVYIASVIAVPSRAMHQITLPITAQYLNHKEFDKLKDLYQKSSINLLVVSGLIFLLIVINVEDLYALIPEEYQIEFSIIVLLSLNKLYDNLLGNSNSILFNSDYYQMVLFSGIIIVILALILNIVLIPLYGIYGAAIATFIAFALYNTIKLGIVYWKFNMQPITLGTFKVLGFVTVLGAVFYLIPLKFNPIVDILIRSSVIGLIYLAGTYYFNFSADINRLLKKLC